MDRAEIMLEANKTGKFGKAAGGYKYFLLDLTSRLREGQ